MLFGATLVGYLVVRLKAGQWPPPGTPPLPPGLWAATAILLASSATMYTALRGVRRGRVRALRVGLAGTLVLALAYLVVQVNNWLALEPSRLPESSKLYAFTFYMLTVLHAAHVVGGLIPLAIVIVRAWEGRYTWASHAGVKHIAIYWHFLDIVWLLIFVALVIV